MSNEVNQIENGNHPTFKPGMSVGLSIEHENPQFELMTVIDTIGNAIICEYEQYGEKKTVEFHDSQLKVI